MRPYHSHKFGFHTNFCVFIGYSSAYKGFKCLHPSGRLCFSKNVIFNQNSFSLKWLSSCTPNTSSLLPFFATLPILKEPSRIKSSHMQPYHDFVPLAARTPQKLSHILKSSIPYVLSPTTISPFKDTNCLVTSPHKSEGLCATDLPLWTSILVPTHPMITK